MCTWGLTVISLDFAIIFTILNSSCGKVMFSQACVKNSVYMRGHVWQGCVCGGPCVTRACMAGGVWGMHGGGSKACLVGGGGRAWQERWPLQRTVRTLLECILVSLFNCFNSFIKLETEFLLPSQINVGRQSRGILNCLLW